jgi:hypothetical protein
MTRSTPSPARLAGLACACALSALAVSPVSAEDTLTFKMSLENDKFTPAEIRVPANKPFVLKVLNGERSAAEYEYREDVAKAYVVVE